MLGCIHKQTQAALIRYVKRRGAMPGQMFTLLTRQNHLAYTDKLRQERERERESMEANIQAISVI